MKGILPLLSSEFFRRRTGEKWKNYFLEKKKSLVEEIFFFVAFQKHEKNIITSHRFPPRDDVLHPYRHSTPDDDSFMLSLAASLLCMTRPNFRGGKISFDDAGLIWEWHERRGNWVRIALSASPGLFVSLAEPSHYENVYEFFPYFRLISLRSLSSCTPPTLSTHYLNGNFTSKAVDCSNVQSNVFERNRCGESFDWFVLRGATKAFPKNGKCQLTSFHGDLIKVVVDSHRGWFVALWRQLQLSSCETFSLFMN